MDTRFDLGDVIVEVRRKAVKHVHLAVHPPDGQVTLVAPEETRLDVARAYAVTRLPWIREQRARLQAQPREAVRHYVSRESHALWGRQHLLVIHEQHGTPRVTVEPRRITMHVRPGTDTAERRAVMHRWHLATLHAAVPTIVERWERRLGVEVSRYFLQRMKTRWGSCNHATGTIRLNTELVKKPKDLLEYVIVHEMIHLIEPTHGPGFVALLDAHYPSWREARAELNELPL